MIPSSNDPVTIPCPVCATPFEVSGKRRFCSDNCRVTAHRRRHQSEPIDTVPVPAKTHRKASTVYECASCEARALGEQRCNDCGSFMNRVGYGGLCPCCDEPVTIDELLNNT